MTGLAWRKIACRKISSKRQSFALFAAAVFAIKTTLPLWLNTGNFNFMTLTGFLLFASVYFVAVASPGPGIAAIVARGLSQGTKAAPAFIAGFVVGDLIWFAIAATGLAAIAKTHETLFQLIKYAGCGYLLFMAWKIWNAPISAEVIHAADNKVRALSSFLSSLLLTLGNPKAIVFFLSVMPLVIDLKAVTPLMLVELGMVIVFVMVPTLTLYLLLADRARQVFTSEQALRRINRTTASIMAGAAVAIASR
jgi:threonine/homoserine/homoserine lactone efflux protein